MSKLGDTRSRGAVFADQILAPINFFHLTQINTMDDSVCLLYCGALLFSSIDLAAIIVGVQSWRSCPSARISFSLSNWLILSGSTNLATTAALLWLVVRAVRTKAERVTRALVPIHFITVLFKVIWFVDGIVLILTNRCDSVWTMGIVQLVWLGGSVLGSAPAFKYYSHLLCDAQYQPVN